MIARPPIGITRFFSPDLQEAVNSGLRKSFRRPKTVLDTVKKEDGTCEQVKTISPGHLVPLNFRIWIECKNGYPFLWDEATTCVLDKDFPEIRIVLIGKDKRRNIYRRHAKKILKRLKFVQAHQVNQGKKWTFYSDDSALEAREICFS